MNKEEAKQKIVELCKKYEMLNSSDRKGYNEEATKEGFILPMFRALGWDTENKNEVAPEEKISKGLVDYAFKIKMISHFDAEAKPLEDNLNNPKSLKQAIGYAYRRGIGWVVLTNFKELFLYNAQRDQPLLRLNYKDYISSFDRLWLLSRDSIAKGLLKEEAIKYGVIAFPQPLDKKLFAQLLEWREELGKQLHAYNEELSISQIDAIIQRLFNRLIFIRTCEDRVIESNYLLAAVHQWEANNRKGRLVDILRKIFLEFDGYYDSELFAKSAIDNDSIFIEDETILNIIKGLYEIPDIFGTYDFSDISSNILGTIYEQYLSYVSSIEKLQNKKERVDLNKKQQKVKEGGIHYTPITITDYIVKETVGRFLKERTSDEIKNIKILDPSCGSGSFLTRAYDELLKYYAEQFAKPINELEQSERLPILANGIFGVDLDKQAVEISRLSLLLCALAERKILPPLTDNIKHGNSLISGTSEELQRYFGNSCQDINAFDWRQEFPDIMVNGGFDIVIGNPPWERIKQIKDKKLKNAMGKWFKKKYSYQRGNFNYYKLFLERSFELLKPNGYFAMIFPTAFLGEDSSKTLRKLFFNNASILKVLEFPEKTKVFEKVTQDVTILIYKKIKMDTDYSFLLKTNINAEELNHLDNLNLVSLKRSEIRELTGEDYQIPVFTQPEKELVILKKISQLPSFKGKGSVPSIGTIGEGQLHETFDKKFMSEEPTGDILVKGIHLNRYSVDLSPTGLQPRWVKKTEFLEKKPIVEESLGQERIIGRNTLNKANRPRLLFSVLPSGFIITNAIKSIVLKPNQKLHKNYIIGLLNSPILNWRFELFSSQNNIRNYEIETLPIPHIDFHNPVERKIHDDLVVLVDEMLELYKKIKMLSSLEIEERRLLERDIQRTDKAINGLVYTLYGLTEDEKVTIEFLTTKPIKKKSEQVQLI